MTAATFPNWWQSLFLYGALCYVLETVWCFLITRTRLQRWVMDVPNDRSSHQRPIPRAGGLLFPFFMSFSWALLWQNGLITGYLALSWTLACVGIAIVGFADDLHGLSAKVRLCTQGVAVLLCSSAALAPFYSPGCSPLIAVYALCWMLIALSVINFYNFADGINGYISLQFFVSSASFIAYQYSNHATAHPINLMDLNDLKKIAWLLVPLYGGLLAFLKENLWKGRVFMGDCGSTSLGLFLALIFLSATPEFTLPKFSIVSMATTLAMGVGCSCVIFLDCACMVVAKWRQRIPLSQPHKNHLYQVLSRQPKFSHRKTSALLAILQLVINMGLIVLSHGVSAATFFVLILAFLLVAAVLVYRSHVLLLKRS